MSCNCHKTHTNLDAKDNTVESPSEPTAAQLLRRDQFRNHQIRITRQIANGRLDWDDEGGVSPLRTDNPVSDKLSAHVTFVPDEYMDSPEDELTRRAKAQLASRKPGKK